MAVEFTPAQQNAIGSRGGSLIVSAAAGSGKTAVLVQRVLQRITDPADPVDIDSLLIVTFTNAAAAEMRERIADSLLTLLAQAPEDRRLHRQLALLGTARIQTVHAFCLDLVRQNFSQCGVNPGFRLLDTAESDLLKEQAMEDMLERRYAQGSDPDFEAAVENFAEDRGDRKLQHVVLELYERLRSHADPDAWLEQALRTVEQGAGEEPDQAAWCRDLLHECVRQIDYQETRLRAAYGQLMEQPDVLAKYGPAFDACLQAAQHIRQGAQTGWDACYEALQTFEKPRMAAVRGGDKAFTDRMKQARDAFSDAVTGLAQEAVTRPAEQVRREMALSLPILRGLCSLEQDFEREFSALKQQRNALDFSDLEHLAIGLLVDRQTGGPTELARQTADGISEILVDEYQDTNEIQDSLFRALGRRENSLFMVGDVKQSIYRFRLAEPEIFVDKYYSYEDFEQDPAGRRKRIMLNQNFRSRREVLELTNFICRRVMTRQFGGIDYDEREELRPGAPYPGLCPAEVYLLDLKQEEADREESPEKALYEAEFVADTIQRQLQETQVTDSATRALRPARPDDVAILLSSFVSKAPLYQQALERRGIPCSAGTGGDLFSSIESAVLRSLLAIIDNPRQDIPLVSVLRSPLYLFTADELIAIRQLDKRGDFYDALCQSDSPHAKEFLEDLRLFRSYAPDMSVGQLVSLIYTRTGAPGVFQALDNGLQRRRNLQRFYQLALQYESGGSRGLFGFLQMLEKRAQEGDVAGEPAPGAVRLMSVHKSKGLEFPIVVVPDLSKRFNTDDLRQPMLLHKRLGVAFRLRDPQRRTEMKTQMQQAILLRHRSESREEELRKLYVAMTRAREKLILTMALPDAAASLQRWEALYDDSGNLMPGAAADQNAAAMWVAAPLLRHPDGLPLREYAGLPLRLPAQDARPGSLYCRVIPYDGQATALAQQGRDRPAPAEQLTLDMPRYKALQQFTYPHAAACRLPSKLTATGLRQLEADSAELEWPAEGGARIRMYPTAERGEAARMGTLVHRCMQLVDLARCATPAGAARELARLREQGLVGEESGRIDPGHIARFAASPLGRLACAGGCLREYQFSALFTPAELGLEGGDEEDILMNGIIDLLLLAPEGAVVVDFKSDAVAPGREASHAQRYRQQLHIYAQAVEKILQTPVCRRVVYFLATGAAVDV